MSADAASIPPSQPKMTDPNAMNIDSPDAVPCFGSMATVKAKDYHRDLARSLTYSLEEGMNTKAIDLLCQVSYAGLSTPPKPGTKKEILIPPPEVLSIITTLSLHPIFTTRRTGTLQQDAAAKASRYLRTIIRLGGATNCHLQQAWKFKRSVDGPAVSDDEANTTRRMRNRDVAKKGAVARKGKGRRTVVADLDVAPFARLPIANEESLFRLCDDIWAVIGWAMVCSCRHPKRWALWKGFLDLLLETLQADFQERIDACDNAEDVDLEGSLVTAIGFLPNMVGGAGYKRVVRAIFANGSEKSRNEWPPVFPKETKKPPRTEAIKDWQTKLDLGLQTTRNPLLDDAYTALKRDAAVMKDIRMNLDDASEQYQEFRAELARKGGLETSFDADDESEDDNDHPPRAAEQQGKEDKTQPETDQHAIDAWGGIDSIIIRLKLMSLLSYLFAHDSATLECFYEEYVDYLRGMPLKQMSLFTSPGIHPSADPIFRASLLARTLQKSMVWQPPRTGWTTDIVTEATLRDCYLPHYARGLDVEAQARMATLVELLARLWHVNAPGGEGMLWTEDMQAAVEEGIAARREKADAALARKKKPTAADEEMVRMLGFAHARLRFLMQQAKSLTQVTGRSVANEG